MLARQGSLGSPQDHRTVANDPRVTAVLVTIRDGVLVVRKKSG